MSDLTNSISSVTKKINKIKTIWGEGANPQVIIALEPQTCGEFSTPSLTFQGQ